MGRPRLDAQTVRNVVVALLIVAGIIALSFAATASTVLALFMDYSFLSIFKVSGVTLTMLFAVGFFLGKSGGGSEKPQGETDKERWDAERQAKTAQERRINI